MCARDSKGTTCKIRTTEREQMLALERMGYHDKEEIRIRGSMYCSSVCLRGNRSIRNAMSGDRAATE